MRQWILALALLSAWMALPGRALAAYPDKESWAESPPSPWTLYCTETLDSAANQSATGFLNPSASSTKQCGTGSGSGGTITDSGASMFSIVTTPGWFPSTATVTRVLAADQVNAASVASIQVFPDSTTFGSAKRIAIRYYNSWSADALPIYANPPGGEAQSRKIDEFQIGPSGTASWSTPNQAQNADNKDGLGTINVFFSSPGTDCDLGGLTRIAGTSVTLDNCSDPNVCRMEKAATWNGTTFTVEAKIVQINSDGSDSGTVYGEWRESCTPSVAPTGFRSGSAGFWINAFTESANGAGQYGRTGTRYISLVVGATTTDTTLGRWIGPAAEIQGGLGTPGQPALMPRARPVAAP